MNAPRSGLPTLTEVVQVDECAAAPGVHGLPTPSGPGSGAAWAPAQAGREEDELALRVLDHLQSHIDLMLERRLRESLAPAIARLSEALLKEAGGELAATLRQVAAEAVARELSRRKIG